MFSFEEMFQDIADKLNQFKGLYTPKIFVSKKLGKAVNTSSVKSWSVEYDSSYNEIIVKFDETEFSYHIHHLFEDYDVNEMKNHIFARITETLLQSVDVIVDLDLIISEAIDISKNSSNQEII